MFKDDNKHETQYCENCLKLQKKLETIEQEYKNLKEEFRYCRRSIKDISIENTEICKILEECKRALDEIEYVADDYNRAEKTSQYYRDGFDEIQDIINRVKEG